MIVAPCTLHGHAQKGLSHSVDLPVYNIHAKLNFVSADKFPWSQCQESCGDDIFSGLVRAFLHSRSGRDFDVAGELLLDELVERFVRIEGGDDVVTVTPGIDGRNGTAHSDGVRVGREIEPMPCPAVSEVFAGKEFVYGFFMRIKIVQVFRRWR